MRIPDHLNPTIVTANGKVIWLGGENDGLIVVESETLKPVISFDEVTGDPDMVNIYIKFAMGAALVDIREENNGKDVSFLVGSTGIYNTHDIRIGRKDLKPIRSTSPDSPDAKTVGI